MNGEHKLILDSIKDVRADIRAIHTRLDEGAFTFATKGLLYKAFGVLFALLGGLAAVVFYG